MDDSPSIVPALSELIALVDQYSTNGDSWETERLLTKLREQERTIGAQLPHLAKFAHVAVEGALYVRRQSDSTREARDKARQQQQERDFAMAAECIARRSDPAYDDLSDIQLIVRVGALPRYRLGKSQARSAILAGMRDSRNIEKIKQFGARGGPNKRRSIFDGTKEVP